MANLSSLIFQKIDFLAHFSYNLLILKYLTPAVDTPSASFVSQANDGVEIGREVRGIVAEEQSHADGNHEPDRNPKVRQRGGNRRYESAHQCGYARPDQNADGPADQSEHHRFQQELQADIRAARADCFAHANFLGALGHRDEHDIHHTDAAYEQPDRTDDGGENHQRASELVPEIAEEVRRAQLEIIFLPSRDAAEAAQRLDNFAVRGFDVDVLRNGERHKQLFGFRVLLLEVAERDDYKDVHAWAEEQSLVVLKYPDDFVNGAIDAHGFPKGVRAGENRFADGRGQPANRPC